MVNFFGLKTAKVVDHNTINIVILGDSNSSIGGDSCNKAQGWTKWFVDDFQPASCRSYARSGATWTNTPRTIRNESENIAVLGDNNVVYNQVCRLFTAIDSNQQPIPDLVIIAAGTNDAWFAKRRPNALIPDSTTLPDSLLILQQPSSILTLRQSVNYCCTLIHDKIPSAKIILLTPMQCTATSLQRIRTTGDIIAHCAQERGLDVIRQDSVCCINREQEKAHRTYTIDGIHTNPEGAKRNGLILSKIIKELLN